MTIKPASMALAAAFTSLAVLGGCVIVDADEHVRADWNTDHDYGALKGADVSSDAVTARVTSNGCTTKDFIAADVEKTGDNRFTVGFVRERPDYCKARIPEGVALTWSFAELGLPPGAEVRIRNKISN